MPLTNADNPTADKLAEKPKLAESKAPLIGSGNSSSPDVQFLASKRAHLVGAIASAKDEIEAIDAQLAELGYKA